MPTIETKRLRMRLLEPADAAFILELLNEPGWLRFIGDRGVRDLETARAYIQNGPLAIHARHGFSLYCVTLREDGTPIGMCGLIKRETLEHVDLGFAFLARFHGQGYAREAAAATLEHARRDFGLTQVAAIVDPANARSIHLLENLGFSQVDSRRFAADEPLLSVLMWQSPGTPQAAV